jgi:hypothetical protein
MKILFSIFICPLICLSLFWSAADYWSRDRLEQACSDWPMIEMNLADLSSLAPKTDGNAPALKIKELYGQIIYSETAITNLSRYLGRQLEDPTTHLEKPDSSVQQILTQNRRPLSEIVLLLADEELPLWPLNVEQTLSDEVENMTWLFTLNRLLICQAFFLQINSRGDQAWLYLGASARLADSLFTQPDLTFHMYAKIKMHNTLLAMRKMVAPVPSWALHWPDYNIVQAVLRGFTGQARWVLTVAHSADLLADLETVNALLEECGIEGRKIGFGARLYSSPVGRPYHRLFIADKVARYKQAINHFLLNGPGSPPAPCDSCDGLVPAWILGKASVIMDGVFGMPGEYRKTVYETLHGYLRGFRDLAVTLSGTRAALEEKDR